MSLSEKDLALIARLVAGIVDERLANARPGTVAGTVAPETHESAEARVTCKGVRKDGQACGSPLLYGNTGFCKAHAVQAAKPSAQAKKAPKAEVKAEVTDAPNTYANMLRKVRKLEVGGVFELHGLRKREVQSVLYKAGTRWDTGAWVNGVNDTLKLDGKRFKFTNVYDKDTKVATRTITRIK